MTITETDIPHSINPIDTHVNDVTKVFTLARSNMTRHKLGLLARLSPHMRPELDIIQERLDAGAYAIVKYGLDCLNRMIEQHNIRVQLLMEEQARHEREEAMLAERKIIRQMIGALEQGDPRRRPG